MITKPPCSGPLPADPRLRAGVQAERQMAFYLHRELGSSPDVLVLNDLRLVDPEQPGPDGRPGVCQIDHLALHRSGAFIIESKSVTGEIRVRPDGDGGDEWTRHHAGRVQGMPSPIRQARRQGEFLRPFLQRHRQQLLGRMAPGLRTVARLIAGTDQRGFSRMPIQLIVAVSDAGTIRRERGWAPPTEPFRTFVTKADLVGAKILTELRTHRAGRNLLNTTTGEYGEWSMQGDEVSAVAAFLAGAHQPRKPPHEPPPLESPAPPTPASEPAPPRAPNATSPGRGGVPGARPACKACGGVDLAGSWGRYGYYWACRACGVNTSMPTRCSVCHAEGRRGQGVRIRKDGPSYFRACEHCGIEERLWTDR